MPIGLGPQYKNIHGQGIKVLLYLWQPAHPTKMEEPQTATYVAVSPIMLNSMAF